MAPETPDTDNKAINTDIDERASAVSLGSEALTRGETVVYLDEQGRLVEEKPDGTKTHL